MKRLHLKVIQRRTYKVTTQQRPGRLVADNILDQRFDPQRMNQVWAGFLRIINQRLDPDISVFKMGFFYGFVGQRLQGSSV